MKLIKSSDIINLIERTLNNVDHRLTGHARTVGYICYMVIKYLYPSSTQDMQRAFLFGLLHDIGAYKTEEIDDMLSFDVKEVWQHSVYGALFLKAFSPLNTNTDCIFYHHLAYESFKHAKPALEEEHLCGLIAIADKAELFLRHSNADKCISYVKALSGKQLSPYWTNAFVKANDEFQILQKLESEECLAEYNELIEDFIFTEQEKEDFLQMLAYAIDFRSSFMVMHTISTVSVSRVIAKLFKLNDENCYNISYGALLHDIGKVATPVSILEKPGKLTSEEMLKMQCHVTLSQEILQGLIAEPIFNIAVRHHEKLDGSGYPQGLVADNLTLNERIVAVADVVSALIRRRSYKEAFNKDKTISILISMKNKLCPRVIDVVIEQFDVIMEKTALESDKVFNKYLEIKKEYSLILEEISKHLQKNGMERLRASEEMNDILL